MNPQIASAEVEKVLSRIKESIIDGKLKSEIFKELVFERVRQNQFAGLPSRYRCFFFSLPNLTSKQICERYNFVQNVNRCFYLLEDNSSSNVIFAADPDLLNCNPKSPHEIEQFAQRYWNGEQVTKGTIQEILANGSFKVIKKLEWPTS